MTAVLLSEFLSRATPICVAALARVLPVVFFMLVVDCGKGPCVVFTTPEGQVVVRVETARTTEEREKGLMFRTRIGEREGMLFVFASEETQSFWMKNTYLCLDIVFLDEDGIIVDVYENLPPCVGDPCPVYSSRSPSRYALELKAGFIKRHGIVKGKRAILNY